MSYEYSVKSQEREPNTLPDVEVFEGSLHECVKCELQTYSDGVCAECGSNVYRQTISDEPTGAAYMGYWYAFGFPGCLWDSEPTGPFETYDQALTAARDMAVGE